MFVNSTAGIAAVRNRALAECARSDLIAFIDDDELPRPGWLPALLSTWRRHGSSAVMGRVISVFDEEADPWVLATGTFRRIPRPTGTPLEVAAAGNLLLDLHQIRRLGVEFDELVGEAAVDLDAVDLLIPAAPGRGRRSTDRGE